MDSISINSYHTIQALQETNEEIGYSYSRKTNIDDVSVQAISEI